jgi:tripartite-type tricarboxylate transporter receptor subunit TctC
MTKKRVGDLRHRLVALAALTAVSAGLASGTTLAADYPRGPVHFVVGYSAGGGTDRMARLLAAPLEEILGKPVTVENVPGAGGQVAAAAVLRSPADGHTILAVNQPDLHMSIALGAAPYSTSDFTTIMVDIFDPRILLVPKDSPYQTFDAFVKKAKEAPGTLTVSATQGGAQEAFAKWLFKALDIEVRMVGYKGGSEAATAMIGGQVDATVGDDAARFNIRDESRALILGSPVPSPRWPEAPTMAEALKTYGVTPPTDSFLARYGVYVVRSDFKKNHPADFAKLQEALIEARRSDAFRELLEKQNIADLSVAESGEGYDDIFEKNMTVLKETLE